MEPNVILFKIFISRSEYLKALNEVESLTLLGRLFQMTDARYVKEFLKSEYLKDGWLTFSLFRVALVLLFESRFCSKEGDSPL